jgi:hypothetical protein
VVTLRRFRDVRLQETNAGRALIRWYYRNSPGVADFIEQRPAFRIAGRLMLWPIVAFATLMTPRLTSSQGSSSAASI